MGLDDLTNKAKNLTDRDNNGRLSKEDLDAHKDGSNDSKIEELKAKADANDDGKISFDDAKSALGDIFNR